MGMVDFLAVRSAFFVQNGLDEDGEDPKKWTWERGEDLSERISKAWLEST